MELLKQHYEKVILGALLLGFILSLVYLLAMIDTAGDVTSDQLRFQPSAAKYEVENFNSREFQIKHILGERGQWSARVEEKKNGMVTELASPYYGIRCSGCKKIVPRAYVQEHRKCPLCGKELAEPPEITDMTQDIGGIDSDGDGMPDAYEDRMGFNKNDPGDASRDADGDGFSNLYEYLMGTDPTDPKSFPGFEKRIYLKSIARKQLPVRLTGVMVLPDPNDKNSKKFWDISLQIGKRSRSASIGDEITVAKKKYRIVDAIYRTRDKQDSGVVLDDDNSIVILEPVDGGPKLELERGKRPLAPDYTAEIEDICNGHVDRVRPKDFFEVGDDKVGRVKFQLISADPGKGKNGLAVILNTSTGTKSQLGDIVIPPHARISSGNPDGGEPARQPEAPRQPRRPRRRRN